MGDKRLGRLPETPRWLKVVEALADDASVPVVAAATMEAAAHGLNIAARDEGLRHALYLLAQVTLAARNKEDFAGALGQLGIHVSEAPSLFEIAGSISDAIDQRLRRMGARSDIGEMAQLAAVESLTKLAAAESARLYATTSEEVREAIAGYSTRPGFSTLAHEFFARLTQRYLTYHLSRELSRHVGANQRFRDPAQHNEFLRDLDTHCRQATLIVKDFAGGWHSKTNYETGITEAKARNFTYVALKKLRGELKRRGRRDVG